MVLGSNPRLMNRVVDAVVHLCEGKGSTARDVLDYLREGTKTTPRNLTMQVHRALKHAVNAGLLRHRSGRYKALFTLNPAPAKQSTTKNNDEKLVDRMRSFDAPQTASKSNSDGKKEVREKLRKQRRDRKRKRSRSRRSQKRRKRRSGSRKRSTFEDIDGLRKLRYKKKGGNSRSPRRKTPNRMNDNAGSLPPHSNRKRNTRRSRDRTYFSDQSDCSDYEDKKTKARRRTSPCEECQLDACGKQNIEKMSTSQNRSPQRQQSQQLYTNCPCDSEPIITVNNDISRNNEPDQDTEKDNEPVDTGSGSTL